MKVELECYIIPVNYFGNLEDASQATKNKLYFSTVEEARNFSENNSDRILQGARLTVEEFSNAE